MELDNRVILVKIYHSYKLCQELAVVLTNHHHFRRKYKLVPLNIDKNNLIFLEKDFNLHRKIELITLIQI